MRRFTRLFRLGLVLLAAVAALIRSEPVEAGQAPANRVVSLNLCTDHLLLALADPNQIAGLSPLVRDPLLSTMVEPSKAFAIIQPRSENLLALKPDLVLAAPYEHRLARRLLAQNQIETMTLAGWTDLADGRHQIEQLADRLGHPERGQALIKTIDEAMAKKPSDQPIGSERAPRFLEIERRLYAPGQQSLIGDILAQWGYTNHAARLGLGKGGFLPLERLLADQPDLLIVTDSSPKAEDLGTALLRHPALNTIFKQKRRIGVPTRLSLCGGPQTPALIDHLKRELDARNRL